MEDWPFMQCAPWMGGMFARNTQRLFESQATYEFYYSRWITL
jgi:hypothetical protein